MEAENTKAGTTTGEAVQQMPENHGGAEDLPISRKNGKRTTRKEALLGSQEERLEILQQSVLNYQKAGGAILARYNPTHDGIVIFVARAGICVDCGAFFIGDDGCPHCRVSGSKVKCDKCETILTRNSEGLVTCNNPHCDLFGVSYLPNVDIPEMETVAHE